MTPVTISLYSGAKFWHTSKIIKALSLYDYNKLDRQRSGEGPSSSRKNPSPVVVSDSNSSYEESVFRPVRAT
jgi:hypothetical protein